MTVVTYPLGKGCGGFVTQPALSSLVPTFHSLLQQRNAAQQKSCALMYSWHTKQHSCLTTSSNIRNTEGFHSYFKTFLSIFRDGDRSSPDLVNLTICSNFEFCRAFAYSVERPASHAVAEQARRAPGGRNSIFLSYSVNQQTWKLQILKRSKNRLQCLKEFTT